MITTEKFSIEIPFHPQVVPALRTLPRREFDGNQWTFPVNLVHNVCDILAPFFPEIRDELILKYTNIYGSRKNLEDISASTYPHHEYITKIANKVNLPEGLSLYPHQEVGVAFLDMTEGRAFIGDEMGLGKTIQVLAWLSYQNEKVLWITKKLLIHQAVEEINKWLPNKTVQVVKTGKQEVSTDFDVTIINYELVAKQNENLMQIGYGIVVLDEMTMIQNPDTKRTIAVKELTQDIHKIVGLSGTPIGGKPKNFFSFLNMLDPTLFPTFFDYGVRYCNGKKGPFGWQYEGVSNGSTLNRVLKPMMIRRLRKDAAKFLPGKTRDKVLLDGSPKFWTAYKELEKKIEKSKFTKNKKKEFEVLGLLQRARKMVGEEKARQLSEIIDKYLDAGEQVVIYVHSVSIREQLLIEFSKKCNTVEIRGGQSAKSVKEAQDTFLAKKAQVMIISTLAGGMGLNLNSASFGFFVERQWKVDDEEQAEDRIYRIGQENPVTISYLHIPETIDDYMDELAESKRETNQLILDGKETANSEQSVQLEILRRMWSND